MPSRSEQERALRIVLEVLREYAGDLVLIGGWVPYLHLTYGRAAVPSARTSLTWEVDLLVPTAMRRGDRRPIAKILKEAGFVRQGAAGVIWVREPAEGGEAIEFMQPLRGPARNRGIPTEVADQPELRVLTLDHLRVMDEFTEPLLIPPSEGRRGLEVRIPTLGAFVLNKANTFHLRGGREAELKAGKDLLYLRDIMAAGDRPIVVLEEDLDVIGAAGEKAEATVRRAGYHLRHVAPRHYGPASEILSERDGTDAAGARADVEGYLTDLAEILAIRARAEGE